LEKHLVVNFAIAFKPAQRGNKAKPRCFCSRVGRERAYEKFLHTFLNDQSPNYFRGNKIGNLKTSASYSKREPFNNTYPNLDLARLFVQRACAHARLVCKCLERRMSRDFATIEGMIARNVYIFCKVTKAVPMYY